MAINAMSGVAIEDYISSRDPDQENPTTWKLKPLNGFDYMEVMSELQATENGYKISGKGLGMAVRKGLVGWDNFIDAEGNIVKYTPVNMQKIPAYILGDLADKIIDISELGDEQAKNS